MGLISDKQNRFHKGSLLRNTFFLDASIEEDDQPQNSNPQDYNLKSLAQRLLQKCPYQISVNRRKAV